MKQIPVHATHEFPAVYDNSAEILSLGSFPSVKSREVRFYYGHPQNRFWKLLASLYEAPLPDTTEEKIRFLHDHHIALWDVLAECTVRGSGDASIHDEIPNDLSRILEHAPIRHIYLNGNTAYRYFLKYQSSSVKVPYTKLPSTSPANARMRFDGLRKEWLALLTP